MPKPAPVCSRRFIVVLSALLLAPLLHSPANAQSAPPNWSDTTSPWLGSAARPGNEERRQPFQVFDNVYYVGLNWVSAFLVETDDGLVLLDATYGDTVDQVLTNIRELGFDPADIGHIIVSHGHRDHYAGAGAVKAISGARVAMSAADWRDALAEQASGRERTGVPLQRDLTLADGDSLTIGGTTFDFFVSPGHLEGGLTTAFTARDGAARYRVLCPGGLGFNFGPERTAAYIASHERLRTLGPWDVVLANHPHMGARDLLLVEAELAQRQPGASHPAALGPAKIDAYLQVVLVSARDKLAWERAHSPAAALPASAAPLVSAILARADARLAGGDWGTIRLYTEEATATVGESTLLTAELEFKPGQQLQPPHRHAEEELQYVISGAGTWFLNGVESPIEPGDLMYAKPWDWHGISNVNSDTPLRFLVVKWKAKGAEVPPHPPTE